MNLHSIKTRLMGSYIVLLALFVIQIPIIYFIVGGMVDKYAQVEEAGSLRKRAAEITDILNRHVLTGNEDLEKVFQQRKQEFGEVIGTLRTGSKDVPALKDPELRVKLDGVEKEWNDMKSSLDRAMSEGDTLMSSMEEVEKTTAAIAGLLSDSDRARNFKMGYLLERLTSTHHERDLIEKELRATIEEFDRTASRAGGKALSIWQHRKENLLKAISASDAYSKEIDGLLDTHTPHLVGAANGLVELITQKARSSALKGIGVMTVSVLFSGAFAVAFMWTANTHMLRPILRIKEAVEEFASGNLSRRAGVRNVLFGRELDDEITSLGRSVDSMGESISGVIGSISQSSVHLASASEELSVTSSQIEGGADKQSSQTAHIATAMEEMNATVIEVAKNSQNAAEAARNTRDLATKGSDVVLQAIHAMQEVASATKVTADTIRNLGKSSEEIGTIVSVIKDIADQTNLLALNAAIEAARAGEQGRGFAVVADEVRKLAERTTRATKEINDMINSIQSETARAVDAMAEGTTKVENGVELANEADAALKRIVTGVESVSDMIGQIATSAEEQSATTEEITQNMDSIAEVARTNLSAIGEVTKASNELSSLAGELNDLVSNFTIAETGAEAQRLRVIEGSGSRPAGRPSGTHLKKVENA